MDQSDLDLLQTVPMHHLESIVKTRRIPLSLLPPNKELHAGTRLSRGQNDRARSGQSHASSEGAIRRASFAMDHGR